MPGKFSLGDESVLPGQVAHAEGGDVSQEDAVKLKCVRAPPADNQDVISELPRPNEAGKQGKPTVFWDGMEGACNAVASLAFSEGFGLVLNQDRDNEKVPPAAGFQHVNGNH